MASEELLTHLLAVYIYNNSTNEIKKKSKESNQEYSNDGNWNFTIIVNNLSRIVYI